MYVAMTRPKEKLILVDALYGAEKRLQSWTAAAACPVMPEAVAEGKCFGDWILLPLLCRPEAAPLRDMAGVMAGGLYTGDTAPWRRCSSMTAMTTGSCPGRLYATRRRMQEKRSLTRRC
ncbi:MAG: hypothetical protein ACLU38_11125 [Dysosmobacter sp.]